MILEISIDQLPEDKTEVIFTADAEYYQAEKQTSEYPGDAAHFEIETISWDRTLYTDEENWIIEDSLKQVEKEFEKLAKRNKKDWEEERMENIYSNMMED